MIGRALLGWRPYALLALLCLGLYLPGLTTLPVTDRDEARFAQATRQMLETDDFLHIRFQDEARNKKPAGIYWLQAASVALFSRADSPAIWPYRLPSALAAALAVLLSFALGARRIGREGAFLGAGLLAAALGLVVEAHLAKTDAVQLACIVAAQGALGEIYAVARRGARAAWPWALLFWAAVGVGILIKGPVAPLLALLTAGALAIVDRQAGWLRDLRPLWGVPLLLLIVLPWLIAITAATGGAFLGESVGHDFLGKLVGGQEGHGAPPLYYLALLLLTFWPGSLFLGRAAAWAWGARGEVGARFLLAWTLPFWVVLELVPTKLPHYFLPAYPALALAAGAALAAGGERMSQGWRRLDRAVQLLWGLASLGLAGGLIAGPTLLGESPVGVGIVVAVVILFLGRRLLVQAWRQSAPALAPRAAILALLVFAPVLEFMAPRLDTLWLSRSAAAMVARHPPPPGLPIAAAGYAEPSLVFLLGTKTLLGSADEAAARIAAAPGTLALVEGRADAAFHQALAARGIGAQAIDHVSGLDYSNGKPMTLTLYGAAPANH